jgi:hypothetical protein
MEVLQQDMKAMHHRSPLKKAAKRLLACLAAAAVAAGAFCAPLAQAGEGSARYPNPTEYPAYGAQGNGALRFTAAPATHAEDYRVALQKDGAVPAPAQQGVGWMSYNGYGAEEEEYAEFIYKLAASPYMTSADIVVCLDHSSSMADRVPETIHPFDPYTEISNFAHWYIPAATSIGTRRTITLVDGSERPILDAQGYPYTIQQTRRDERDPWYPAAPVDKFKPGTKMSMCYSFLNRFFEDALGAAGGGNARIALIGFDAKSYVEVGFTDDIKELRDGMWNLPVGSGTNYEAALARAVTLLTGRNAEARANRPGYLVFLSDGATAAAASGAEKQAAVARQYAKVYCVGYGASKATTTARLAKVAGGTANVYANRDARGFAADFARDIAPAIQRVPCRQAQVTIPLNTSAWDFVDFASQPTQGTATRAGGTINWWVGDVTDYGRDLELRVIVRKHKDARPQEGPGGVTGYALTGGEAALTYVNHLGHDAAQYIQAGLPSIDETGKSVKVSIYLANFDGTAYNAKGTGEALTTREQIKAQGLMLATLYVTEDGGVVDQGTLDEQGQNPPIIRYGKTVEFDKDDPRIPKEITILGMKYDATWIPATVGCGGDDYASFHKIAVTKDSQDEYYFGFNGVPQAQEPTPPATEATLAVTPGAATPPPSGGATPVPTPPPAGEATPVPTPPPADGETEAPAPERPQAIDFRGVYPNAAPNAPTYTGSVVQFALADYDAAAYAGCKYEFAVLEPGNEDLDRPDYTVVGPLTQGRVTTGYLVPAVEGLYTFWVRVVGPTGLVSERRTAQVYFTVYDGGAAGATEAPAPTAPPAQREPLQASAPKTDSASSVAGEPVRVEMSSTGGDGQPYYYLAAIDRVDPARVVVIREFSRDPEAVWENPEAGYWYLIAHAADASGGYGFAYIAYDVLPGDDGAPLAQPQIAVSAPGPYAAGQTLTFTVTGVEGTGKGPYRYYYEIYHDFDPSTGVAFYGGNLVPYDTVQWTVPAGTGAQNWQLRAIVVDANDTISENFVDLHTGLV